MELSTKENKVSKKTKVTREDILDFQDIISNMEGAFHGDTELCPLKHTFADGIYVREITIPKGTCGVGKIHKHDHPNFLLKGKVKVITEGKGFEVINAPCAMISDAGTKRIVETLTDTVWVTVHTNPTNTRDLVVLEKHIIAESFEVFEKFKELNSEKNPFKKGIIYLKQLLKLS